MSEDLPITADEIAEQAIASDFAAAFSVSNRGCRTVIDVPVDIADSIPYGS
jgi:hypothetical protein